MGRRYGYELARCAAPHNRASIRICIEALERRTLLSAELVGDILPPSSASFDVVNPNTSRVIKAGDSAFFATSHYPKGRLVWKTDGTPDGTRLVADFTDYPAWKPIEHFVEHNNLT